MVKKYTNTETLSGGNYRGFIKIWRTNIQTGESELLIDKPNMILYQGADLLSLSLSGRKNAYISHLYIGYHNAATGVFTKPTIDKAYSEPIQDYADPFGYLRLPLTFPATFLNQENYNYNTGVYTVVISSATKWTSASADFQTSASGDPSWIFEIGLVASLNSANDSEDIVFSRANFEPIKYESGYNLTISWGVQILAEQI